MSDTADGNRTETSSSTGASAAGGQAQRRSGGNSENLPQPADRGRTTIADGVVEKIAGMAAREVDGIHAMGGGVSRTFGAVRDRVPGGGKSVTRGVKAEVGEVQSAVDLEVVVEYGVNIKNVCRNVRVSVVDAVEQMAGLEVVEVNIAVSDVKLPDEEDEEETEDSEKPRLK